MANQQVKLWALITILTGATTTSVVLKIRQTDINGTTVATSPGFTGADITTPKVTTCWVAGIDSPVDVAGLQYALTATCAGAGGAATVGAVYFEARIDS